VAGTSRAEKRDERGLEPTRATRRAAADPRRGGRGGGQLLSLVGELDVQNAETLAVEIAGTKVAAGGSLTIDLRELTFIDSTGIALLVSVFRRFNADDNRLHLLPSRAASVRRVMELTGLDRTLPFVPE
jgi:anti-sigma B factor antagonist